MIPIGEVFGDLDGPVKELRHHFTQADQVNQLVEAREADPDLGLRLKPQVGIADPGGSEPVGSDVPAR